VPRRILLVDDDIAEISAVKRVLTRAGHQPVLATNARDALVAIGKAAPDLLLVSTTCEGGEGLALAQRLAADGATGRIPIVLLGESSAAPSTAVQLPRPVDPGQLDEQVAALLQQAPETKAIPPAPVARIAPVPRAGKPAAEPPATDPERKAAADALRARAAELRKAPAPGAGADRAAEPAPGAPSGGVTIELDEAGSGLDDLLKRAEQVERAAADKKVRALADRARSEAAQRAEAEQVAIDGVRRARAAEEKARAGERARADAEAKRETEAERRADAARRAEEERRRAEEERLRADEERRHAEEERVRADGERRHAEEEARRAAEAEEKARAEERLRTQAEASRKTEAQRRTEAALRATAAEDRARLESSARAELEGEVQRLRDQLASQQRDHEARLASMIEQAAVEEKANEELRRIAEDESRRREEDTEVQLRAAIDSARSEMDALRRRSDEEARRRADAEAELARLAQEAGHLAAERSALAHPVPPSAEEEALRRRIHALREDRRTAAATGFDRPAWLEPAMTPLPGTLPAVAPGARPSPAAPSPPAATPMVAPPPELRAGTLADLPAPRLLTVAARARLGGRLDFNGAFARSLYFEEGRVVGATSNAPEERVEEVALRLSLVTRDQHRTVAAAAATLTTRRAAVLLLERGFLKPTELPALVRRRAEEVVFGVFGEDEARFRWASAEVPPDERTPLDRGALALAVEGVRRRWLAPRVDAVLGGSGTLVGPAVGGPSAAELALAPEETRVVALADGLRTLGEIVQDSPLDPLTTRQVLAALVLVGALSVKVLGAGKPASAAAAAIDLARVREKLDQARRSDYFTILGVGRLCTPHEVREAADRLLAEFAPHRYAGFQEDGLAEKLDEIGAVVRDARDVLADDRLRGEYLQGLGG